MLFIFIGYALVYHISWVSILLGKGGYINKTDVIKTARHPLIEFIFFLFQMHFFIKFTAKYNQLIFNQMTFDP